LPQFRVAPTLLKAAIVSDSHVWALVMLCAACAAESRSPVIGARVEPPVFATEVVMPAVLRGLPIGPEDATGRRAVTPCATCHGMVETGPLPEDPTQLAGPHAGLRLAHGNLRCAACHQPDDRSALHLADGRSIPITEAMTLCAQCHGPQKRDYDHGAHGGMRGYWDLSRGPRQRNHCVACHDPHAPAFGAFAPVPGPRDRFSMNEEAHGE
jgi:hypothetical protein